ncbi:MAG TPA: penicillin-binding protein [Candidatus Hydrogenedentes bacterium]|nr:penicillin-binding protein [Candidatus Hydrogenedentota bacterium]
MDMRRREESQGIAAAYGGLLPKTVQTRLKWVLVAFFVAYAIIGIRLFWLQLNPRHELTEEEALHIGEVELREPRGEIFDRNGLMLATERQVPSLWADPRLVRDAAGLSEELSKRLGLDPVELLQRFSQKDSKGNLRRFVWVKRWLTDVPESVINEIQDMSGGAVAVQSEPIRFYPQGDTASHLLGFVNRAGEACEGLEQKFDKHLRSVPGKYRARKDGTRQLLESLTLEYQEPRGGESVQLTIDSDIQHTLERALDQKMEETKAEGAMGLIMNPFTGALLALATRPAFDPNRYDAYAPELRKNSAIIDVFEPGSSFKIVTASAALEQGIITPETMINCENGSFNPYGHRIKDVHKMGTVPFTKCFEESSNIAMIKVGAMLGPDRLSEWISRYGFGEKASQDFSLESAGLVPPRKTWSRLTMGSLPMGQEVAVTMTQLARAFAVIANGGYLVEPYFVERAVSRTGEVTYWHKPETPVRLLSPGTAETMKRLCFQVVLNGTGQKALIPEYRAGGKTGTAQVARPAAEGGGFIPGNYTAIFAGFAPVNHPQVVAVIIVKHPLTYPYYGGWVCGPVFKNVVRDTLIRLNVPEDPVLDENGQRIDLKEKMKVAEKLAAAEKKAKKELEKAEEESGDADTIGDRADELAFAASLSHLWEPMDGLELGAENPDGINRTKPLPDFTGMTKRKALETLRNLGIPWDPKGTGWVVAQTPAPGTPLGLVPVCTLEFSPKPDVAAVEEADGKKQTT